MTVIICKHFNIAYPSPKVWEDYNSKICPFCFEDAMGHHHTVLEDITFEEFLELGKDLKLLTVTLTEEQKERVPEDAKVETTSTAGLKYTE